MENNLTWEEFEKVDIRVGTIIKVEDFPKARNSSYIVTVDFGKELGIRKTAAQITLLYEKEDLIGKQIIAVVNFPPKQIANIFSECLLMGVYGEKKQEVIIINPEREVENGSKIG